MDTAIPDLHTVSRIERPETQKGRIGNAVVLGLIGMLLGTVTLALPVSAQDTKRVVLSPKSNISTSEVAEGFHKYCPNVLVTEDPGRSDFTLEAAEEVTIQEGESARHWHFTLLNKDGDVVFTTHPKFALRSRFAHHFEDTCKFINGGQNGSKKKK